MSSMTIAQKIEKELAGKKPEEIVSLDLSGCTGESFEGLTDKFTGLKELKATDCGLKSCDGLPALKNLVSVDLSGNEITDLKAVAALPNLLVLELVNNNIEKSEILEPLFNHKKLESLSIEGNPVRDAEGFLDKLFSNCPFLVAIDGINNPNGSTFVENGEEFDEEEYDSDVTDSEEDEEEIGLEHLQRSGDLEEDEDDYNPEGDDDEEEEEDFEDEEGDDDENGVDEEELEGKAGKKRKADIANGNSNDTKQQRLSEANGDAE